MGKEKFGAVCHVHCNQRAWLHALAVQVLAIAAGVGMCFSPGVAAVAGPDCLFLCGEAANLRFELVPEGLARGPG